MKDSADAHRRFKTGPLEKLWRGWEVIELHEYSGISIQGTPLQPREMFFE